MHWGTPGYQGFLNRNCVTLAEVLKTNGYHTYMTGKWHVGMNEKKSGRCSEVLIIIMAFWQEPAAI